MVELPSLRTGLGNDVAAALRAAQDAGRVVLTGDVAGLFRLPVAPGVPHGTRTSVRLQLELLGVVALLCAGIALGLAVG